MLYFFFIVISFRICVANRYKLDKKYRKLLKKSESHSDDLTMKTQASSAQVSNINDLIIETPSV